MERAVGQTCKVYFTGIWSDGALLLLLHRPQHRPGTWGHNTHFHSGAAGPSAGSYHASSPKKGTSALLLASTGLSLWFAEVFYPWKLINFWFFGIFVPIATKSNVFQLKLLVFSLFIRIWNLENLGREERGKKEKEETIWKKEAAFLSAVYSSNSNSTKNIANENGCDLFPETTWNILL